MTASTLMVQGTASSVGKSLLVTALCRYFARAGLRVAPFKAQNMALNAAVTPDGREIGRAQAVQAEAAGIVAEADLNPILLKPEGEARSQVVVLGQPLASMSARAYHEHKPALREVIAGSLARLRARFDLVVIEGAGSPAEINLKDRDLVNMHVARVADAPVLLAGDIDRGGVFAAFVGTLALLDPDERDRIAGFVVNKFRGDLALLAPGLDDLTRRTGKPTLGVLPYLPGLRLPDEDSLALDDRRRRGRPPTDLLDVVVVRLPRISNHDDVLALEHAPGVSVRFTDSPADLASADLVIVPGSKSTVSDLAWVRAQGLAEALYARAAAGGPVLGVCGGCQLLGEAIDDPDGVESSTPHVAGLGLLPVRTRFARQKITAQVRARVTAPSFLTDGVPLGAEVGGYELHMGVVEPTTAAAGALAIVARGEATTMVADGAIGADGAVVGTMIHGLLDDDTLRAGLLAGLRRRRGLSALDPGTSVAAARGRTYDRLAAAVAEHLDLDRLWALIDRPRPRG